jgi:hypothetical protein
MWDVSAIRRRVFKRRSVGAWIVVIVVGAWKAIGSWGDAVFAQEKWPEIKSAILASLQFVGTHSGWFQLALLLIGLIWIGWIASRPEHTTAVPVSQSTSDESQPTARIWRREAMQMVYPVRGLLRSGHEYYAIWLSGRGVFESGADIRAVKQLILAHPESDYVSRLQGSLPGYYDLPGDIRGTTQQARHAGVAVRWFRGFGGVSVLICDPNSTDSWAHVELILPFADPSRRPILRLENRSREYISDLHDGFRGIWNASEDPS